MNAAKPSPTDYLVDEIVTGVVDRLQSKLAAPKGRRLLTVERAAEYLDYTVDAVRHMIAAGTLRAVRIAERGIRLDIMDLDAVIEERKR